MRPNFNFKTALKMGGLALAVSLIVGLILLTLAPNSSDPTLLGQGVGQFAGLSFVGGFLTSFQEQTGNVKMALLMKAIWLILIAGLLLFGLTYEAPVGSI